MTKFWKTMDKVVDANGSLGFANSTMAACFTIVRWCSSLTGGGSGGPFWSIPPLPLFALPPPSCDPVKFQFVPLPQ